MFRFSSMGETDSIRGGIRRTRKTKKKNAMRMNAKEKQGRVNERVITFESKNLQELFFMDRRCMKKVKITCNLHF